MATKITTKTVYSALFNKKYGTWYESDFVLVRLFRFGDSLIVYYDAANGLIYPWNEITIAIPK